MKTTLCTDGFFTVEIGRRFSVTKKDDDFGVMMEELKQPGVVSVYAGPHLFFEIEQTDGWTLRIKRGIYEKDYLVITRFRFEKPDRNGHCFEEYLTKNGKWVPKPDRYGPFPDNALMIPAPKTVAENNIVVEPMMEAEG